jgi:hypothetical protein
LISHFSGVFTSLFGIAQMSQKSGVFSLFIWHFPKLIPHFICVISLYLALPKIRKRVVCSLFIWHFPKVDISFYLCELSLFGIAQNFKKEWCVLSLFDIFRSWYLILMVCSLFIWHCPKFEKRVVCSLFLFEIFQKLISHFICVFSSLFGIAQISQKSGVFSLYLTFPKKLISHFISVSSLYLALPKITKKVVCSLFIWHFSEVDISF